MIDDTSTLPGSGGLATTVSIVNLFSQTNTSAPIAPAYGTILTLSGALTAATPKTMLNISGQAGVMPICALRTKNTTSRTITLIVTLDGNATTFTSNAITTSNTGIVAAGAHPISGDLTDGEPLRWKTSCLIQIQSSLTETDFLEFVYKYQRIS